MLASQHYASRTLSGTNHRLGIYIPGFVGEGREQKGLPETAMESFETAWVGLGPFSDRWLAPASLVPVLTSFFDR